MGIAFPLPSPLPATLPPIFRRYVILTYITTFPLVRSKRVTTEIREIKSKKYHPCRWSTAVDPAKRGTQRTRIGPATLDFRMKHCQLTARAWSGFLFGNTRLRAILASRPFLRFAIGGHSHKQGLSPHGYVLY